MKTSLLALLSLGLVVGCGDKEVAPSDDDTGDTGVDEFANISVSETNLDFGEVYFGDRVSNGFTITNSGATQLEITTFEVPAPFEASIAAGITVSAGTTLQVTITYDPDDYAADSGDIIIGTNDPDTPEITVAVSGSVITDADEDGFASTSAGGDDCDDEDPAINPDADDEWYDGEDSNCDGANDYDQDGDGFEASGYNDDPEDEGGDCQDANPDMYPGAEDIWYDGEDTNCDGADDYDQDGDEYGSAEYGAGSDCDDTNPEVNRDGTEVFNGLDDDCDDEVDNKVPGTSAEYVYYGTAAGEYAGFSVAIGDFDVDGYGEVVGTSPNYSSGRGAVAVFDGYTLPASGDDLTAASNLMVGDGGTDTLGQYVSFHGQSDGAGGYLDFDGDGYPEMVLSDGGSSSSRGTVYLINGDDVYTGDTSDAYLTVTDTSYYWGDFVYEPFDMDGDGYLDLAGSAYDGTNTEVFLLYGGTSGAYSSSTVDALLEFNGATEYASTHPPRPGDLDGDGYDDIVACDFNSDYAATNDGEAFVLWGDATRHSTSGSESWTNHGDTLAYGEKFDQYGMFCAIGPDWDGDGDGEYWSLDQREGMVYIVPGGTDLRNGAIDVTDHAMAAFEWAESDPTPMELRVLSDMDGDGYEEVAMGMETTSTKAGQVWVYGSATVEDGYEGDLSKDYIGSIVGSTDGFQEYFAYSLATGDIDGDGGLDLIAGDYYYGDSSTSDTARGGIWFGSVDY